MLLKTLYKRHIRWGPIDIQGFPQDTGFYCSHTCNAYTRWLYLLVVPSSLGPVVLKAEKQETCTRLCIEFDSTPKSTLHLADCLSLLRNRSNVFIESVPTMCATPAYQAWNFMCKVLINITCFCSGRSIGLRPFRSIVVLKSIDQQETLER